MERLRSLGFYVGNPSNVGNETLPPVVVWRHQASKPIGGYWIGEFEVRFIPIKIIFGGWLYVKQNAENRTFPSGIESDFQGILRRGGRGERMEMFMN